MTALELLVDFHKDGERQGPGSVRETLRALECIEISKKKDLKIADIGCGTGGQTITLAQHTDGQTTAVDLFPEFLERLNQRAKASGLQERITTVEGSMEELPFDREYFDIIWSEGAIYNMGFEAGIKRWKDYLKPNGYLSVSEITWITHSRPKEIQDFWKREYPEIDTASNKISILEANGYSPVGYFYLSQNSWIDNYFKPMESRFSPFLERHNYSQGAKNIVEEQQEEIRLYHKFKAYFSYGFYIARKIG